MTAFTAADFAGFLDDAAVFPPGNASVAHAVDAHLARRSRPEGRLVGPLVVTPAHLDAVRTRLDATGAPAAPLALSLVVRDPAGLPAAARTVSSDGRLRLAAAEIVAPGPEGTAAALEAVGGLGGEVTVWVEPGWGQHLADATSLLARAGRGLKLRTGGTTADAFPDETALACAVAGAVARGVPFKATAGLHHAVRHTDPATGFEHHGFVNLLLAAAAADGGAAAVTAWLTVRDAARVGTALAALGPDRLAAVRRERFVSFGTCDVDDPRRDLEDLGLLRPEPAADTEGVPA